MINDKSRPAKSKIGHIPPQIDIHDNSKKKMPEARCKHCGSLIVGEDAIGHVCSACKETISYLWQLVYLEYNDRFEQK